MGTKKKKESSKKGKEAPAKAEGKKEKKADKPGTAKYEYPKDCTSDGDKKKYRSLMRAGKAWEGPGKPGAGKKDKKDKKDKGTEKAVILDGKGKKVREEENPGGKKKKKKSAED